MSFFEFLGYWLLCEVICAAIAITYTIIEARNKASHDPTPEDPR